MGIYFPYIELNREYFFRHFASLDEVAGQKIVGSGFGFEIDGVIACAVENGNNIKVYIIPDTAETKPPP